MMKGFKDIQKENLKALEIEQVISHIEDGEEIRDRSLSKVTRDKIF